MADPLHLLLDACNLLFGNINSEQADQIVPAEQGDEKAKESDEKAKESKGKAPHDQPDGYENAKESKGKSPLEEYHPKAKDSLKCGRRTTKEHGDVQPNPQSDGDGSPKEDTIGPRRRRRRMEANKTEEAKALKEKFERFKAWQTIERARRSMFHRPLGNTAISAARVIATTIPTSQNTSHYPWQRSGSQIGGGEAWTPKDLDSLWVGVRNYGHNDREAVLADPSLNFSKTKSPQDLFELWNKDRSTLLLNKTLQLPAASHSARIDIDLNQPLAIVREEEGSNSTA